MANSGKSALYNKFIQCYVALHSDRPSKQEVYSAGQELWRSVKNNETEIHEKIKQMKVELAAKKSKNTLFWTTASTTSRTSAATVVPEISVIPRPDSSVSSISLQSTTTSGSSDMIDLEESDNSDSADNCDVVSDKVSRIRNLL